ncbi:hypothetical protein OE88DRAFT_1635363 [Heliocybe sulcata]|uniref:Glycosyl transferase family 25 domain-containing protein n=1 Tax=Heliocybe sulcata TaxID=5364 RepID=A0A5C3MSM6_9AGAM|nr:hypothetical protein OE88DRAFT_1635363 [Heliocybe sulcata]
MYSVGSTVWGRKWPNRHDQVLANASHIYVISLPRRVDRRRDIETLFSTLGLHWDYEDAVDADDEVVSNIYRQVQMERSIKRNFSHNWASRSDAVPSDPGYRPSSATPLTCATEDNIIPVYNSSIPTYMVLKPAKIACWHSHLSVLRKIANAPNALDSVSVILEDDVDMEHDIEERLYSMWPALPPLWDMIFLGHCWSDESLYPPLPLPFSKPSPLHPSSTPKCTHAYAVTKAGARRLLLHLRHPPFAYSRALDQAYSWLIQSGRLTAFSVVPSIVIQRKVGQSDVWNDGGNSTGSRWRDTLAHGVLGPN